MDLPFLNPWMLAALPAAGIPVLIHLLNRHRAVTIEWGAMELLRRVMVFRSRQIRLEDILLMAVRCAIVLVVLLALARPTTRWVATGDPDTGVVIALDGSLSMAHRPGLASRFECGVERARDILRTLQPHRPVTLVLLGRTPRVLLRSTGYDPARLESVLKGLQPLQEAMDLEAALAELKGLAAELKAPRREVHLVTDAQAATFGNLSPRSRLALEELASAADVFLMPVACGSEENLAVTQLELASGALRVGAIARFQALVKNHGRAAQDAGELSLRVGDRVVDKRFVGRLAPGQTAAVPVVAVLDRAGVARLTAQVGDDALSADNRCYGVIHVRSAVRVLCVDGDPVGRLEGRAAALVATALAPPTLDPSEVRPDVELVPWTALASSRLTDYDVVVLVNVPHVPEDKAVALRAFVEQGGGLVLLAGGRAPRLRSNRAGAPETRTPSVAGRLARPAASPRAWHPPLPSDAPGRDAEAMTPGPLAALLPAEVVSLARDAGADDAGTPLDLDLPDHPLSWPLRSLPKELLGEVRVRQFLHVQVLPEARAVLRLAGGEPLLVERQVGRGKVLLWTSGADFAWSNVAANPLFPVLLQQAVTHLVRQAYERPVAVPGPIVLPTPMLAPGEEVAVTGPDGRTATARAARRAAEVVVECNATWAAGFYELQPPREGEALTVAANVDAAESDVKVLSSADLEAAVGGPVATGDPGRRPVRVVASDQNVAAAVSAARTGRELWQVLVMAGAVLLAAEALLARWTTRRGA